MNLERDLVVPRREFLQTGAAAVLGTAFADHYVNVLHADEKTDVPKSVQLARALPGEVKFGGMRIATFEKLIVDDSTYTVIIQRNVHRPPPHDKVWEGKSEAFRRRIMGMVRGSDEENDRLTVHLAKRHDIPLLGLEAVTKEELRKLEPTLNFIRRNDIRVADSRPSDEELEKWKEMRLALIRKNNLIAPYPRSINIALEGKIRLIPIEDTEILRKAHEEVAMKPRTNDKRIVVYNRDYASLGIGADLCDKHGAHAFFDVRGGAHWAERKEDNDMEGIQMPEVIQDWNDKPENKDRKYSAVIVTCPSSRELDEFKKRALEE